MNTDLLTILIGTAIGIQLTQQRVAGYHHKTERSEKSQETDEDLEAAEITTDLHRWIEYPDSTDFFGIDDPYTEGGVYAPWREFQ